ncbi:MAG: hypothetical protein Q7R63_00205 [bacterium]|nr:hypothetical protein [bacterium]
MPEILYAWKNFEFPILQGFAVTGCLIESYSDGSVTSPFARGTITFIDYVEHAIIGTDAWTARRITATEWCVESAERNLWGADPDGRLRFTASERIDSAMQAFISESIVEYEKLRAKEMNPETTCFLIQPEEYKGTTLPYTGACVCSQLNDSPTEEAFPWHALTGGGQYPNRCFACSCGQCWWLPDKMPEGKPSTWMHVSDPLLFKRLLWHNGVRTAEMVMDQRTRSLELLTTYIRRTGVIMLLGPLVTGKTRQRGDVTITSLLDMVVEG